MKPVRSRLVNNICIFLLIIMPAVLMTPGSAIPQMASYCYLPPFVMDPSTPPNILIAYEKGSDILKRAYSTAYTLSATQPYYGFFDSSANYLWDTSGNYFIKNACTPNATNGCFPGDLLNWALMSSLDLSRKALVGFGQPDPGASSCAGKVFTYTGTLTSYGQWADGNTLTLPATTVGTVTYNFELSKTTGSNPTGITVKKGATTIINNKSVAMRFTNEKRYGLIQEYMDKDMDYRFDTDAPRFSIRRWNNGADKQTDIIKDSPAPTAAERQALFEKLLCAISKAPPDDPATPHLGEMMKDIVTYMKGNAASFTDNDSETQTPYSWANDPGKACRRTFALFVTTGTSLGQNADKLSTTGIAPCGSLTYTDAFPTNTCVALNSDLYTTDTPVQNIKTFVAHTTFYGSGAGNEPQLTYAAKTVGGGEYIKINNPADFEEKLRQIFENILATATSASTVATLTTQTRESSTLTQAFFYPRLSETSLLRWIGFMRLLWSDTNANLREDTQNKGILDVIKDKILSFFFDTSVSPARYRARLYSDDGAITGTAGDFKIDSCSSGISTKDNDLVENIWEAQNLLKSRTPDEASASKRNIRIGIDANNNGTVVSGEVSEFTTALKNTLQPYWNAGGFCSNNASRWCATNADCNSCSNNTTFGCSTNADCSFCSLNSNLKCSSDANCQFNFGTCTNAVADPKVCENDQSLSCTADTDCSAVGGLCKFRCSANPNRLCTVNGDCVDNYGTCTNTGTCNTAAATCNAECDVNCAESVIKFVRGYDKPTPSGANFRIRHECASNADCPTAQTCNTTTKLCSGSNVEKTHKLGDIVYSTPRLSPNAAVNGYDVRYADNTYREFITNTIKLNTPIVVVGANDGMVHAFKVGKLKDVNPPVTSAGGKETAMFVDNLADTTPPSNLGEELWSFIPYNVLPFLKWYCDKDYCHIPMVDARFTIVDASIANNASDDKTSASWKRLLIGTMGVGGKKITTNNRNFSSSMFVVDITNPSSPVLLWERKLPDETLTTSNPAIVRLGAKNKEGSWYVVIGSGAQSISTNTLNYKSTNARLFVFNLRDGTESSGGSGINLGAANVAVGDILATDLDGDYQVDALYFGSYNTSSGNFYRLRIRNGFDASTPPNPVYYTTPSSWVVTTMVSTGRPVFASPEVAVDAKGTQWLYFGTGLFLTLEHTSTTTEYIYGVKEVKDCWLTGTGACTFSNFFVTRDTATSTDVRFINALATELTCYCAGNAMSTTMCSTPGVCPGSPCGTNEEAIVTRVSGSVLTGSGTACDTKTEDAAINCLSDYISSNFNGWKRQARTSKAGTESNSKIFAKPFVGQGLVNLTAYTPLTTACSLGGETYLISMHYTTGTAYAQPTILSSGGTTGNLNNVTIQASTFIGTGVPPLGESIIALPLPGDAYKVITQVSGALPGTSMSPSAPAKKGYLLWLTK